MVALPNALFSAPTVTGNRSLSVAGLKIKLESTTSQSSHPLLVDHFVLL